MDDSQPVTQPDDRGTTVRYAVPEGMDPAPLLAALGHEGFDASMAGAVDLNDRVLAVRCDSEADRERVRHALAAADANLEGDPQGEPDEQAVRRVRFLDE